ncbi:NAD(P)/FAD-dependent oxidoreductase [Amycolatopsis sp.]|uniref:flavin-containing monooxygenase n=1 Tax=Amycolatopsis sp. TaxID=37632 RepID=UPI002BCEC21E|nr:NAD(P)/FAD-dependent oxidoreductase [Amycolatopsis sp.]HVV10470.1 NAD(P)/FAD-dependent oxidoreductase [Amycolatopsis sp.]
MVDGPSSEGIDVAALKRKYRDERDKRLGADRRDLPELTGPLARYVDDPYTKPSGRPLRADRVDVVVVGAGLGGLMIGAALRDVGVERIRLIDTAGDVGGVWYWNRYPGARCDVESLIYLPLLEEVGGPLPSEKYAPAAEILAHAQRIAKHYGLYEDALFQTTVEGMEWEQSRSEWVTRTDRGDEIRSRFVILANGPLTRLKLPAVPGIETFGGTAFHTSRWDFSYTGGTSDTDPTELGDKVVGVVGTGATAIQCVPPLARSAKHLFVFQRTPSTISVRDNHRFDPEWLSSLEPGWQAKRMRNFIDVLYGGDPAEDLIDDGWTHVWRDLFVNPAFATMTPAELAAAKELADARKMEEVRGRVARIVRDPNTAEALKPYYAYICKRPGFSDEYLDTFNRDNVTLVDTLGRGLEGVTPSGVVANGRSYDLDCLVFATGFESAEAGSSFTRRIGFDVLGRDGVSLSGKWADGLATLHGLMTARFPNMFVQPAPGSQNTEPANYVHTMQENARHMAYVIGEVRRRGARTFEVTAEAEESWVRTILDRAIDDAAFLEACTPGRRNADGHADVRPAANKNFGGGPLEFYRILGEWRAEGTLPGLSLDT